MAGEKKEKKILGGGKKHEVWGGGQKLGKDNDKKNNVRNPDSVLVLMIHYHDNVSALFAFYPSLLQ